MRLSIQMRTVIDRYKSTHPSAQRSSKKQRRSHSSQKHQSHRLT